MAWPGIGGAGIHVAGAPAGVDVASTMIIGGVGTIGPVIGGTCRPGGGDSIVGDGCDAVCVVGSTRTARSSAKSSDMRCICRDMSANSPEILVSKWAVVWFTGVWFMAQESSATLRGT
jgi:hypothetical protein